MDPLHIRIKNELLYVCTSTLLLDSVILLFPSSPLRGILAILLVLLFPGYLISVILFPRKGDLTSIERIALSLGLSLSVTPIPAVVMNYTPRGITLETTVSTLTALIFFLSYTAWHIRQKIPAEKRFIPSVRVPSILRLRGTTIDKILSIVLLFSIVLSISTLAYTMYTPERGENFTEFFILDRNGSITEFPKTLSLGEPGWVKIVVINEEQEEQAYRVEVKVNQDEDPKTLSIGPLEPGEKWEENMSFTPSRAGKNQKVEFLLYKGGSSTPYLSTHIYVDVVDED